MKTIKSALRKCLIIANSILLRFRVRIIVVMPQLRNSKEIPLDYIRYAALRLISDDIKEKKLLGDVAELGVFRGDFAKRINEFFPDRALYLFDTFEGFDRRDIDIDKLNFFSDGTENFTNTNINLVMEKMPNPQRCKIIKGFFPDSLSTLPSHEELRFCFVSLDADLYQPIYEGLCYFYPKLCNGGVIMIHDYNNSKTYKGVKAALHQFSEETAITYVPLPDTCGSVVIIKP